MKTMITTTTQMLRGKSFTVVKSDTYLIRETATGAVYSEAWYPEEQSHEFTETDILLVSDETEPDEPVE